MIEIDRVLVNFLNALGEEKSSDLYQAAYKFEVANTLSNISDEFNQWKKALKPYEKDIVAAVRELTENVNPVTEGEYSTIPQNHKRLAKFFRYNSYVYFEPDQEDMALYFWIKYPDLKKFPGLEVRSWPDGDIDDMDFMLYEEKEIRDWCDTLTLEEYRELFNNNLSVDEYIRRHPLR